MKKHIIKIFVTLLFVLFVTSICYAQYNSIPETQIAFKSTSTMIMSGSQYASTPSINEYGMAVYGNSPYMNNNLMQRRNNSPGTPGGDGFQQPVGDVPIIAFICFICFYLLSKKNKQMVDD